MGAVLIIANGVIERERRLNNSKIKTNHFNKKKSLEDYIQDGQWPADGLPGLQVIVYGDLKLIKANVRSMRRAAVVDPRQFTGLQSYILAVMYVFSPNGRVGAMNKLDLDLGTRFAFDEVEFALSKNFKTHTTYTYQAISLIDFGKLLLQDYIAIRSKYVQDNAKTSAEEEQLLSPTSVLFLSSNLKPINGSSMVSEYFKKHGYQITSDLIRKMFETETDWLTQKGLVSQTSKQLFIGSWATLPRQRGVHT